MSRLFSLSSVGVFPESNDTRTQAINNVFYLIQTIVQNLYRTTYGFIIISRMTASSRIERTHTLKQDLRDEGRIGAGRRNKALTGIRGQSLKLSTSICDNTNLLDTSKSIG